MLIRAKLGEWMRSRICRPRASPLTRHVLPAPRSPDRPRTQPLWADFPQAWPSVSVSSGLCEMHVAMRGQGTGAVFVAQGDALASHDFADTAEAQAGKLFFPSVQQRHHVTAGHGEQ